MNNIKIQYTSTYTHKNDKHFEFVSLLYFHFCNKFNRLLPIVTSLKKKSKHVDTCYLCKKGTNNFKLRISEEYKNYVQNYTFFVFFFLKTLLIIPTKNKLEK